MFKVQYIWHDCFLLENEKNLIIFDFWKDPATNAGELPLFLQKADKEKPIYVLVSHHHKDHYVKDIFDWSAYFCNIHYILSHDTAKFARHILTPGSVYNGIKPRPESVSVLKPGESYSDENIIVEAFGSTDIGNSYVVRAGGKTIFHAGDLNAWIWKDESTPKEVERELKQFMAIAEAISIKYPKFDAVMFPVDSRIGTDYFTGAKIFAEKIDAGLFFPMHFGLGSPEEQSRRRLDAAAVEKYANPKRGVYVCLQSPYSCFLMTGS